MRRGTTPGYVLTIAGRNLSACTVYVTLSQYNRLLTLTGERLTVTYDRETAQSTIMFALTQEETLALKSVDVEIQVRFIDAEGYAEATEIERVPVLPVLNEDVIAYENEGD